MGIGQDRADDGDHRKAQALQPPPQQDQKARLRPGESGRRAQDEKSHAGEQGNGHTQAFDEASEPQGNDDPDKDGYTNLEEYLNSLCP